MNSLNIKHGRNQNTLWWGMPTHHQSMFFRTSIAKYYRYDESLTIAADYKLCCEFMIHGHLIKVVDEVICRFFMTGVSNTKYDEGLAEQYAVRKKVLQIGMVPNIFIYFLKKLIRIIKVGFPILYKKFRY